jgi:hypothetical protein
VTVPFGADAIQAVTPGGAVTLTQTFETTYGSGQPQPVSGVTITISQGGVAVLGPTSSGVTGGGPSWSYTWKPAASMTPGDCLVTFTGTGTSGPVTYTQAVTVAALPSALPSPGVYATVSQYQDFTGDTNSPAQSVTATLRAASEVIDRAMIGAVYRTDADSMPTDPGIISIFMRATCAQAQFMIANNDPANVKSQYAYTSQGGMQVSRGKSAQGQIFPPLAPRAAGILQTVGALPGAPLLGF